MGAVVKALLGASRSLVHPIILAILLVPMLVALAIWIGVGWIYWDTWTSGIQTAVVDHANFPWTANWDVPRLGAWLAVAVVLVMLAPFVIMTALLIATVFAMPGLVRHVAKSSYPNLARRHGGTVTGSIWNASTAIFLFTLLWIVTLPLWLLGPLAVCLPLLLSAYLNQHLFRYDALADHAEAVEMARIFEVARGRLLLLGLVTGVIYFIPPCNLIAPVFAALAFIHLCMDELERLRPAADAQEGPTKKGTPTCYARRVFVGFPQCKTTG